MYNGIGLATPRGSGTNGHVQRNWALVKPRVKETTYKTEEDLKMLDSSANRQPNKEILDHERKRKIELKCAEFADILEEQGFTEEAIKNKVNNYRNMLLGQGNNTEKSVDQWGRSNVTETHQVAEAQQEKNARLREAFGISEYFVDGSSFDPDRSAKEKVAKSNAFQEREKQKAIERELELQGEKDGAAGGGGKYHLVHTPSPEPVAKPKKNNDDKSDVPDKTSKKKKRKHRDSSSSDEIPKKKKKKSKSKKRNRHRSSSKKEKKKKRKRHHKPSTSSNEDVDSSSSSSLPSSDEHSSSEDEKKHKRSKKKKEKKSKKKRRSSVSISSSVSPKRKKSKNKKEDKSESVSKKRNDDENKKSNKKQSTSPHRSEHSSRRRKVSEDRGGRDYSSSSISQNKSHRNESKNSRDNSRSEMSKRQKSKSPSRPRRSPLPQSRHRYGDTSRENSRGRYNRSRRRSRSANRRRTRSPSRNAQTRRRSRSNSSRFTSKNRYASSKKQHSRSRSHSPRRRRHRSRSDGNGTLRSANRSSSPNKRRNSHKYSPSPAPSFSKKKNNDRRSPDVSPQRKQREHNVDKHYKSTNSMSPKTPKLKQSKDSDDESNIGKSCKKGQKEDDRDYKDNDANRRRSSTGKVQGNVSKRCDESSKEVSIEKQQQKKPVPIVKLRHTSSSDEDVENADDTELGQIGNDYSNCDKIQEQQDDKELHMLRLLKTGLAAKAKEALEKKHKGMLQETTQGSSSGNNSNIDKPTKDTFDIALMPANDGKLKVESTTSPTNITSKHHLALDHFDICTRGGRPSTSKSLSRSPSRSSDSSNSSKSSKSSGRSRSRSRLAKADRRSRSRSHSSSSSSSSSSSGNDDDEDNDSSSSTTSRSRSPSIPRRHGSPSFLDRRRITSARKRPIPYHRHTPSSPSSLSGSSMCSRHSSPDSVCTNTSWQYQRSSRNCSTLSRSLSRSPTKSVHSTNST